MSGVRLRPDQRDRLLALIDMLAAGSVLLRGRLILQGRVVVVADELFAAVGSTDKLPGTVVDMLQSLYMTPEPPRTYGAACRLILLEHSAVEVRRAEQAEEAAIARREAEAEERRLRSVAKSEAEAMQRRAERAQRKAARHALRVAA